MKKVKRSLKPTKNIFTIPLIVVSLLVLGVLIYAAFTGTDFRSRAAGKSKIVNPIKQLKSTPVPMTTRSAAPTIAKAPPVKITKQAAPTIAKAPPVKITKQAAPTITKRY